MSWKRGPCPQGGGHLAGGRVQETNSYRVKPCNVVTWWPGKGSQLLLTNQWKKIDTEWRPDPKQLPPPGFPVTCPQGSASPGPLAASCGLGTESQKTTCTSHIRKLLLSQSSASIRGNRGTKMPAVGGIRAPISLARPTHVAMVANSPFPALCSLWTAAMPVP